MGNDITKGTTYADGMMLNAANLNSHVDDSSFKYTCINARTAKTPMAVTDELLINDSGTLKKVTGSALYDMTTQTGAVIQSLYGTYAASANITTVIPGDDTLPQIGEGTEILSVSFTPRFVNSVMLISFSGYGSTSNQNDICAALFRGAGPNAIHAEDNSVASAGARTHIGFTDYPDSPATVSTVTYSVRVGPTVAGTLRMNGTATARFYGGASHCILSIKEIRQP